MEPLPLSFRVLLGYLHQAISRIEDPRQASNGTRYSLKDAILATFSVFFMQCESFPAIRDAQPALLVNCCERVITGEHDGLVLYHNALITHHRLSDETVAPVVTAGRSHWKTETENHNVLKTKGYHLEHNFGHGQQHLARFLLTLNLGAFLFHTVLDLVDVREISSGSIK